MNDQIKAPKDLEEKIDNYLGLKLISLRLSNQDIDDLKLIAKIRKTQYQKLMRNAVRSYISNEFRDIVNKRFRPELEENKNE